MMTELMKEFLVKFLEALMLALLPLLVSLLVGQLVKVGQDLARKLKARNAEAYEMVRFAAMAAVKAAEQANLGGLIEEKKAYAIDYVERFIEKAYGVKVDVEVISQAIEAAVYDEFNRYRAGSIETEAYGED